MGSDGEKKEETKLNKIKKALCHIFLEFIESWFMWLPIFYLASTWIVYFHWDISSNSNAFVKFADNTESIFINLIQPQASTFITVSAILIGFYVTTMSVFGTSVSQAVVKISKGGRSKQFIKYSSSALFFAFLLLIFSIALDVMPWLYIKTHLYITVFLWMLFSAIRFAVIIIVMYWLNINSANEAIKREHEERAQLLTAIQHFESFFYKMNDNLDNVIDEINDEAKSQRDEAPPIPKKSN